MEEFGIAPRQVATKDEFLLSDKKAPKRPKASLLEDGLCSMIVPARYFPNSTLNHLVTVSPQVHHWSATTAQDGMEGRSRSWTTSGKED